jgi:hypothetical protein
MKKDISGDAFHMKNYASNAMIVHPRPANVDRTALTRILRCAIAFLPRTTSQVSLCNHRNAIQSLDFSRLEGDWKAKEGGRRSLIHK